VDEALSAAAEYPTLAAQRQAGLRRPGTSIGPEPHANHESPRMTKLYDGGQDEVLLDEVERIAIRSG
jgi:hypothetical protein